MRRHYIVIFTLLLACNTPDRTDLPYTSPNGYNLSTPQRYHVRQSMQEISGIVLAPDEHHMLAINDEQGRVFGIDVTGDKPYPSWKFDRSGDYEDLATDGQHLLVLKSNGHLYEVNGLYTDSANAIAYKLHHPGKQEFESLYFDPRNNGMVMICKECAEDQGQMHTTAYRFDMGSRQFDSTLFYQINVADIARFAHSQITLFKPSGAAIHPIEKRLYILSAVNRLLVITDLDGKVLGAHNLRHSVFKQPEGITFSPNGDMYISNESVDEATANILKFAYHPSPLKQNND